MTTPSCPANTWIAEPLGPATRRDHRPHDSSPRLHSQCSSATTKPEPRRTRCQQKLAITNGDVGFCIRMRRRTRSHQQAKSDVRLTIRAAPIAPFGRRGRGPDGGRLAARNGGSARDYPPGFALFGAPVMGPTRERLSVCLFIGALDVNFRICRRSRVRSPPMAATSRTRSLGAACRLSAKCWQPRQAAGGRVRMTRPFELSVGTRAIT